MIVTNNHVVEGGQEIMVVLADRREFPAKVLRADSRADIAVLKIDVGDERLPVLALDDRDDAQVGDLVLAIGDPFGVRPDRDQRHRPPPWRAAGWESPAIPTSCRPMRRSIRATPAALWWT